MWCKILDREYWIVNHVAGDTERDLDDPDMWKGGGRGDGGEGGTSVIY